MRKLSANRLQVRLLDMAKRTLDDILANDTLIEVPKESVRASTIDARIQQGFEEICRFVEQNGRPPMMPDLSSGNRVSTSERTLAIRLKHYRSQPDVVTMMLPYDRYRLLAPDVKSSQESPTTIETIDDIFERDDGILDDDADDIFNLRFVGKKKEILDFVADRTPCDDFHLFQPFFDKCAEELARGERKAIRFANEQEISVGDFFILNGIIVYVAELNDPQLRNGRPDARLRCIFDNGTESDMLLRSLARQLYNDQNGRRITNPEAGPLFASEVRANDIRKGCVYIATTLSEHPSLTGMKNLYKVGVTTGRPERRVKQARLDPTFLLAPAKLVKTYTIYNADPKKVESILHSFLADVSLGIELKDRFGNAIKPREWFIAPLDVIDETIKKLMEGTISEFQYDRVRQMIIKKR